MITFTLTGQLMAEARPGQLTNELVRDGLWRNLEQPNLDPDMRLYYESKVNEPLPREGIDAKGERYTMLRVDHEGRRFEVSVGGKLVDRAIALEVGQQLRLSCELLGQEPHLRIRATKIVAGPVRQAVPS